MTDPYYQDDAVTLYHGDCREVTEWLAADVLVTDPPYGRSWRSGTLRSVDQRRGRVSGHSPGHQGIAGDATTAVRDAALTTWGDGRPVVCFGDLMVPPPHGCRQVLVYRKPTSAGMRGAIARRRRDLEAVYLIGPWPSGIGGASSLIATAQANVADPGALTGHPHTKPIDVMCELVEFAPGVVADPFAGSGSTLFAAKYLGRRAIGVEIEERYCEIAAKRLSQDVLDFGEMRQQIADDEVALRHAQSESREIAKTLEKSRRVRHAALEKLGWVDLFGSAPDYLGGMPVDAWLEKNRGEA